MTTPANRPFPGDYFAGTTPHPFAVERAHHKLSFQITSEQRAKGFTCRCFTCGRHFADALDVAAVACEGRAA